MPAGRFAHVSRLLRRFSPITVFLAALVLLGYVAGSANDGGRKLLAAAETALEGAWLSLWPGGPGPGDFVGVPASAAAAHRFQLLAPTLAAPVLVAGGRHRFLDHCPGFVGCLAVEYDRRGLMVHAYPFRPEAYEAALVRGDMAAPVAYERGVWFDLGKHADVFAMDRYANGDLAVVLHSDLSFPSYIGIARVDRDGWPRWFRADGSHHWPTVSRGRLRGAGAGLQDALVVPSVRVRAGQPKFSRPAQWEARMGVGPCAEHLVDHLHVIDGDGALLEEISVLDALGGSRHRPLLDYSFNACDPLHLNSVSVLTAAAAPLGLAAGDFLVSLRGVGALAALDGRDGRLKRIWRGSFYGQHSARVLPGSRGGLTFLLFDNWGRSGAAGGYRGGRLLALDPVSGRERTIFPNASGPATVQLRSMERGGIAIAPDGSRAIVYAYRAGVAVEVDLSSGETTATFRPLDDISPAVGATDRAFRWNLGHVQYVETAAGGGID